MGHGTGTVRTVFEFDPAEIVGYAASVLVIASLSMRSVVRLRALSLVASATFAVYGLLLGAAPIVVTNLVIVGLNIWFLRNELGGHRDLGASVVPAGAPFLHDFLDYHRAEITDFQPTYLPPADDDLALLLTRDGLPAGVVVGRRSGTDLHVTLDFVLRPYRDSRLGGWLFGPGSDVLRRAGVRRVTSDAGNDAHRSYLERVGFRWVPDTGRYELALRS